MSELQEEKKKYYKRVKNIGASRNSKDYIKELEKTIGDMDGVLIEYYKVVYIRDAKLILEKYHGKPIGDIIK